jgi:hypothetical protein
MKITLYLCCIILGNLGWRGPDIWLVIDATVSFVLLHELIINAAQRLVPAFQHPSLLLLLAAAEKRFEPNESQASLVSHFQKSPAYHFDSHRLLLVRFLPAVPTGCIQRSQAHVSALAQSSVPII